MLNPRRYGGDKLVDGKIYRHFPPPVGGGGGGSSGGTPGASGVIDDTDLTFLGGFRMPYYVTNAPLTEQTIYTGTNGTSPTIALRRVSGNVHLFSTGNPLGGGYVYEVTVPASGTWSTDSDPLNWPQVSDWKGWGNVYFTYDNRTWYVRGGTNRTVTLSESSHLTPHYYSGWSYRGLTGGTSGVERPFIAYDTSTRVGTVAADWTNTPQSGDAYVLFQNTLLSGDGSVAFLPSNASSQSGAYDYQWLWVVAGVGSGVADQVTSYSGGNKRAELRYGTFSALSNTSKYRFVTFHRPLVVEGVQDTWDGGGPGQGTIQNLLEGLYWDEADQRLYWTYGHWYHASVLAPSIGYSTLDPVTTTALPYGPWRLRSGSPKWARGGVLGIGSGFVDSYLDSGRRLAVGFGGYYSLEADASYGPALGAIHPPQSGLRNQPGNFTVSDASFPKLSDNRLLGHPAPGNYPTGPVPAKRNSGYLNRDPKPPFLGRQSDDYPAYNIYASGVSQGGVSGTINDGSYLTLNSGDPAGLYYYNGCTLTMGGSTSGSRYFISSHTFSGDGRIAFLYSQWSGGIPVSGDSYHIRGARVFMGPYYIGAPDEWKQGPYFKENRLAAGFGCVDHTLTITSGTGSGQVRFIGENFRDNVSTMSGEFSLTVTEPFTTLPLGSGAAGLPSAWRVTGGTARSGSTTQITLRSGSLFVDFLTKNYYVCITGGAASGDSDRLITAENAHTKILTVSPPFSQAVDNTSEYGIYATGFGGTVWDYASGTGYWTWEDTIGGAAWFEGANKQGVIVPTQQGMGYVYYEASDRNSTSGHQAWFYVYNPNDFLGVLSGTIEQHEVDYTNYFTLAPLSGIQPSERAACAVAVDHQDKTLYVLHSALVDHPDEANFYPAVLVYQIND